MFTPRKGIAASTRVTLLPAVVAALALLTTACAEDKAPAGPPPPTLDRYYQQTLAWGSCDGYQGGAELGAAGLECARVTVPIDYGNPDGDTGRIALSRLRAAGKRVASLLTNPGGPGAPGLDLPLALAKSPVAERFDLIGMDVRGLGASTPHVTCRTAAEFETGQRVLGRTDPLVEIDQIEEENEEYANSCARRTGLTLLGHVGTVDVARDMDVVRAALGEQKLTYFGGSYGTRLGSTYAELFPDRVRAMVLDAPVDPTTNISDPVITAAGFQRAFDAYAADCAKSPDCPLGTDPAKASEKYRALVKPLIQQPISTADRRKLDYGAVTTATIASLYHPASWPGLTRGLTELARGHGEALLGDAGVYEDASSDEVHRAVLCLEEVRVTDRAVATDIDRRSRTAAPAFDDGLPGSAAPLDACAFWPVPPTAQPHVPHVAGLPKLVVVAVTGDPATPYPGGVSLAKTLGASLITYEGTQHGAAFEGIACVDEPVLKYLVDLTPPAEGLRCSKP
ncbi:alpha/beta hydrolase family protein [Nocardia tenerifensis]|uniref:Alpha/beta hydrolase family protein n=1 Tax=Nocardia tenerifensis TaxID=228006 RepID=A0A318K861_9NOCA|nr:alpha/beta hydrolase [Nocardia tenerifensis]PXX66422.1 alpha/beta hydrolase family protein [Nocardia tenerifensis]